MGRGGKGEVKEVGQRARTERVEGKREDTITLGWKEWSFILEIYEG